MILPVAGSTFAVLLTTSNPVVPLIGLSTYKKDVNKYDMLICDIRMPGKSGIELAKEIKKANQSIHIVLMSDEEKDYINQLATMEEIKYLVLTGFFTDICTENVGVDMLVVADKVDQEKFSGALSKLERYIGREINYTLLSSIDFDYRKSISDKFLYDILTNKKIVVVDKLTE